MHLISLIADSMVVGAKWKHGGRGGVLGIAFSGSIAVTTVILLLLLLFYYFMTLVLLRFNLVEKLN